MQTEESLDLEVLHKMRFGSTSRKPLELNRIFNTCTLVTGISLRIVALFRLKNPVVNLKLEASILNYLYPLHFIRVENLSQKGFGSLLKNIRDIQTVILSTSNRQFREGVTYAS